MTAGKKTLGREWRPNIFICGVPPLRSSYLHPDPDTNSVGIQIVIARKPVHNNFLVPGSSSGTEIKSDRLCTVYIPFPSLLVQELSHDYLFLVSYRGTYRCVFLLIPILFCLLKRYYIQCISVIGRKQLLIRQGIIEDLSAVAT